MGTSRDVFYLRHILELCKAGSRIAVETVEALIAGDPSVEPLLIDLVRSRAIREDAWGPLWSIVILGERRSPAGVAAILEAARTDNDIVHEDRVALGPRRAAAPILAFLRVNPASTAASVPALARSRERRALDLIRQLRLIPTKGAIAWALAETRDPETAGAEAITARFGQRDRSLRRRSRRRSIRPPRRPPSPRTGAPTGRGSTRSRSRPRRSPASPRRRARPRRSARARTCCPAATTCDASCAARTSSTTRATGPSR